MAGHRDVTATVGGGADVPRTRFPLRPLVTAGIAIGGAATVLLLQPGAGPPTVAIPAPANSAETSTWLGDSIPVIAGEVPGETMFKLPSPSYLGRGVTARSQASELHIDDRGHADDPDAARLDALFGAKTRHVESRIIHLPDGKHSDGTGSALPGVDAWQDLLGDGPSALDLLNGNGLRNMANRVEMLIGKGVDDALECTRPGCERADSGVLFGSGGDDTGSSALDDTDLFLPVDGRHSEFDWGSGSLDGDDGTGAHRGPADQTGAPAGGTAADPATSGGRAGNGTPPGVAKPRPFDESRGAGSPDAPAISERPVGTPEGKRPGVTRGVPETGSNDGVLHTDGGADHSDRVADGSGAGGSVGVDSGAASDPTGPSDGRAADGGGADSRSHEQNSGPHHGQGAGPHRGQGRGSADSAHSRDK